MKIEWLYEAQAEYRDLLSFHLNNVGRDSARRFADRILGAVGKLEMFPEMGVLRENTLLGKHGFRALFIGKYACIYRIDGDFVYIYHLTDARTDYMYRILGVTASDDNEE